MSMFKMTGVGADGGCCCGSKATNAKAALPTDVDNADQVTFRVHNMLRGHCVGMATKAVTAVLSVFRTARSQGGRH